MGDVRGFDCRNFVELLAEIMMSGISEPDGNTVDAGDFTNKRLLVITPNYPNEDGSYFGGVFVKNQVDALKQNFKEVIVITPVLFSAGRFPDDKLCHNYTYDNVRVFYPRSLYIPWPAYRKLNLSRIYFDTRASAVQTLIEKEMITFDLVHAHFVWPSAKIAQLLKKKYHVPCVVTAHGYDVYELPFRDQIWQRRVEIALNSIDRIITVSKKNQTCLEKIRITTPVTVIPNGFSDDLFYPRDRDECRKILGLPRDKKIILTVGNLVDVKGHRYLIEAMERLSKQRADMFCVIVGSGFLQSALEEQIEATRMEESVFLAGGKPHEEIPLWMNACDVFVLPSLMESFGIVQIEAMACGKPVVGTCNGGSEELILPDKNGLLCSPRDPECLAAAIANSLERDWDVSEITAFSSRYSWGNVVQEIREIYQNMNGL
ncbi:glycosyltransferase family 4 protein [Methanogenium sp. S4BF]|uniref:glycosyltransferase family 4 protein n=1 Tax=Methanogenium sp. S4BF TaxID=1789226 RepID=UPI0024169FC2|nr:glycosyltransferase family 4 protein [Methanogenium sp. S4BF]WFN34980.1 glycosyltransferase family 4 protein [Methanogenium sp. S4BF]